MRVMVHEAKKVVVIYSLSARAHKSYKPLIAISFPAMVPENIYRTIILLLCFSCPFVLAAFLLKLLLNAYTGTCKDKFRFCCSKLFMEYSS